MAMLTACGGGNGGGAPPVVGAAPPVVGAEAPAAAQCPGWNRTYSKMVYVDSRAKSTAAGCGATTDAPCASIDEGLAICKGDPQGPDQACAVFVRHGLYPTTQTLALVNGVDVIGSCRFPVDRGADANDKPVTLYRTVVDADLPPNAPAILAESITSGTNFVGVAAVVRDAPPASASVGLLVRNSKGLVLQGVTIASGRGGAGADGATPPAPTSEVGGNGRFAGAPGGRACGADGLPGRGGSGGAAQRLTFGSCFITCNCRRADGFLGQRGADSGTAQGGSGGDETLPGNLCTYPGNDDHGDYQHKNGCQGRSGVSSSVGGTASGDVFGGFGGSVWTPVRGNGGGAGDVGAGGGGGTSGGACAYTTNLGTRGNEIPGSGAGGGGGGGCGGPGGQGGDMGGASIPLVLVSTTFLVPWSGNVPVPGPGGAGGRGGDGASGGAGAAGGHGITSAPFTVAGQVCPGAGGNGGSGGDGGAGSGGAGGNGGPSIGVGRSGTSYDTTLGIYPGTAGAPGAGGAGGASAHCSGAAAARGNPGATAPIHAW